MKTQSPITPTAHAFLGALVLLCGSFFTPSFSFAQTKGDDVRELVDAAAAAVTKTETTQIETNKAEKKLEEAVAAELKAEPERVAKEKALATAQDELKDARARKEMADKGAAQAEAEAKAMAGTHAEATAKQKAAEARAVAQAAARAVDAKKNEVLERATAFRIASAAERAAAAARAKANEMRGVIARAFFDAQQALATAEDAAKKMVNQDKQQARLLSRIAALRTKLAGIK